MIIHTYLYIYTYIYIYIYICIHAYTYRVWCVALFSAICLHPFDPYTLSWRDSIHVIDRRLRVPYDPVFY